MTTIELTPKQCEYAREAHHRWNLAIGAVRSGKSHLAVQYLIPERSIERRGLKGLNFILGASRENIERNVLTPLRDIWGEDAATDINNRGISEVCGETFYCMGADNRRQVSKIRGSEIKYCYCDELCDISEEVFDLLKSRLSLPYSCMDGAANPAGPDHFVKRFIDTPGLDMYVQHYTVYDNPFLPEDYVRSLEAEYRGTIFYDRYILGKWTRAEGLVYQEYDKAFTSDIPEGADEWVVSLDYGTMNAFAALKWKRVGATWYAVEEYYYSGRETGRQKTDADYVSDMLTFCSDIKGSVTVIVDPSATSFITALRRSARFKVRHADNDVVNGIRDTASCMASGRIRISNRCERTRSELGGYVWDDHATEDRPVKENDHACDAVRYFVRTLKLARAKKRDYTSVFRR